MKILLKAERDAISAARRAMKDSYNQEIEVWLQAQAALTQKATLKEVGDWLEGVLRLWEDCPGDVMLKTTIEKGIDALKRGEKPE